MLNQQDGLSQKELIAFRDVAPATITRSIQRMEKSGFVEKRWDEQDGRISRIYLTQGGKAQIDTIRKIDDTIDEKIFQGFDEKEKRMLEDYLQRMIRNMQEVENEKTHIKK
jgi:DNA-binding MarR family transcriptional regulator